MQLHVCPAAPHRIRSPYIPDRNTGRTDEDYSAFWPPPVQGLSLTLSRGTWWFQCAGDGQRACSGLFRRPMQLSRCPLSLRPRSGEQVPSLTVQIARASNPGGTTAMWVRDRLDGLWCGEDFAGWYPRDGRPGISSAQLATVCVLQFLPGLSDRQAAEAVRCRIDFTYALAMELDDPGFHHSVLADFRERLAQDDRADRLLDLALARLKKAGLVRERTTQHTDSTHVLAAACDLTRLELVTEAVRAVLEEVARTASHLLTGLVNEEWGRRYSRPVRPGKNPTRPKTRILAARRRRLPTAGSASTSTDRVTGPAQAA